MLQNATPLRKSAPGPPNSSDEHVSCTAPATENASLQILFKCPTPAIAFWNATKPSRFAHFWHGAQSFAPATRNDIWTFKSAPYPSVLLHFWLGNVLRATMACTFGLAHGPASFVASTITKLQVWMNASTDSKKYPWQWWTILVSCWRTWLKGHFFDEDLSCLPPSWASCLTQRPFARKESILSAQSFLAFQTCCWWLVKSKHQVSSPLRWLPA